MSNSFLEKLKKGMDIKDSSNVEKAKNFSKIEETENLSNPEEIENFANSQEIPTENSPHIETVLSQNPSPKKLVKEGKEKKKTKKPSSAPKRVSENKSEKKKIQIKEPSFIPERVLEGKEKKWFEPEGQLVVDVYQTNKDVVIQSAIAGVKPEDLDISVEDDTVTIRGKREKTVEESGRNYFYQECHWGHFSREIILPVEVDESRAEATMKEGILTIKIPIIEREGKKKIIIK